MRKQSRPGDIDFEQFQLYTFGTPEELASRFGSLDAAAAAWKLVRDDFLNRWNLWGRPEAWWLFEPDVPEQLRTGPSAVITKADADAWNRLDDERRAYLASIGVDPTPHQEARGFEVD